MEKRDPSDVEEVGTTSGKRGLGVHEGRQGHEEEWGGRALKKQERFQVQCRRYSVHVARTRTSYTAIKELLGNEAYTEAVPTSLMNTDVGKVKAGVLDRDRV